MESLYRLAVHKHTDVTTMNNKKVNAKLHKYKEIVRSQICKFKHSIAKGLEENILNYYLLEVEI